MIRNLDAISNDAVEADVLNTQFPQTAETARQELTDYQELADHVGRPVSQTNSSRIADRGWRIRAIAALVAMIPLSALGLARSLEPSSLGLGTHQQLGLPPCSMRLLLGIRCPGCGMTTSWAHFTRGNWGASVETSVGGFLFAMLAAWIAFLGIRTTLSGQMPRSWTQQITLIAAAGIFAVALLQWLQRLLA